MVMVTMMGIMQIGGGNKSDVGDGCDEVIMMMVVMCQW